ncbi:MAG: hypothetical protein HOQ28_15105 [Thermoleophilia bacterium]|nr:hypothetical protein [Thermoleophilia bacterium]
MRSSLPQSLAVHSLAVHSLALLAALIIFALAGSASARQGVRPAQPVGVRPLRSLVDHYRTLTWTYERAARRRRTPTSFVDRRSRDRPYLQWSIDTWTRRADVARRAALARIERRLSIRLPKGPRLHARLARRVNYSRRLTIRLRRIYPGTVTRRFTSSSGESGGEALRLWQRRSALAAVQVVEHAQARPSVPDWLNDAFLCIHRYEGAWTSDTGNGYYGGLQMDLAFQALYGSDFARRWGTADAWPPWAQIQAAVRAYQSGRGFDPWPRTARACGLL